MELYRSHAISIGSLQMGGHHPVRIQSMTNTDTNDVKASVDQCIRMIDAGAELVRLTTQGKREVHNLEKIRKELLAAGYRVPVIADIHFKPDQALGYEVFLSGYEPYVIDGSDYVISLYDLKFQVVKPNSYTIPFIKMNQFNKLHYAVYVNVFADAGYVNNVFPNPTNTMVNTWQFSAGAGIDLVTYYDKVFSINYVINRYGEHGFFLHLETPFSRW